MNVTPDVITNNVFLFAVMNALVYFFTSIIILLTPFAKKLGQFKNLKPVIILLFITLLMLVLNAGVHYIVSFDPISFTATLILSLIYLIVSVWYINNFYKYEMKIEEEKQQAFYNESLSLVIQDLRRFKHDQANHLTVISAMLKMKKFDQANSYISEIFNTTESIVDTSVCDIKNAGLFGLISSKMDYAKKTGIKFNLQAIGEIDSIPNVKISELCEIIGIYLDNAIEAAAISSDKEVEMRLENKEESIDIVIDNSCSIIPNLESIRQDGYSTKGTNRGHGLSIVDKILSKYASISNTINFDNNSMIFSQILKIKKGI
ncbi:Histidine kinase-, DNA gyrase B-, and HSP90-like ATPase [Ruminiclostridium cellobioparum subsp. termitidis CT1112]|uniref:Histidine kinase-, DNA gyrase B-, and HSP90-like ATPase n=1 Tax=Ruminiclostridium cellobioparum subsp. termitidis CT1112 TaxID=1195236 RepID=S0FK30_RUMCE|nr:Histidine kinase-, DNA gyrase B-, and HSP90-like ATPase [Ruminiclostridium cellobioparum subsp. termitidis CT1112]